jgi:2,4-dienoyl-CoA reductase (NADPH2)
VGLIILAVPDYEYGMSSMVGIASNYIPGLQRLTSAVHITGTKIAGSSSGRSLHPLAMIEAEALFRLRVRSRLTETLGARAREIPSVQEKFAEAAIRAIESGFDARKFGRRIPISQFLSLTNLREDGYGGSIENRMRFMLR